MKVAIVKTGLFETFNEHDRGEAFSLGDVLRSTPLLSLFPGHEVHWFTSSRAAPLLAGVPEIHQVRCDLESFRADAFDRVVNLERGEDALGAVEAVRPERLVGFIRGSSEAVLADSSGRKSSIPAWKAELVSQGKPYWQDWLFALFGRDWRGERYFLGDPAVPETSDVGLNWKVGVKWPLKSLPSSDWRRIAENLGRDHRISWQEGFDDLNQYLRWISSCRLIVTHDSLGMHLAMAMKKKVVVYFGPTNDTEIHLYGRGKKVFQAREIEAGVLAQLGSEVSDVFGSNQAST